MTSKRVTLIHPTGNPNSRNAALALGEAGILHEIVTTIAYRPSAYDNLLPDGLRQRVLTELQRRMWVPPPGSKLRAHPTREGIRLFLSKVGIAQMLGMEAQQLVDWVYCGLDQHVAASHLARVDAIYAYEDGAATTFQTAKGQGTRCFYDLPIMFYRMAQQIQQEEAARFPELAAAMPAVREPLWKLARKEQEIQMADHIFVASSITRTSLVEAGVEADRITVIPYGAPVDYFYPQLRADWRFRAIFVGLISPRKGMHYLLRAWRELNLPDAELLLVGANQLPAQWLQQYADCFRLIPSVPHQTLNAYYSRGSIFVFPSLVEGFGMVLLEAMACGLPIITTPNTAGPDIITDGVEGFIVPIRDVEALKEKLEWCYQHPHEVAEMGRAARRRAEELTWDLYRQQLAKRVMQLLEA